MRYRKSLAALLSISLTAVASFPYATAAGRSTTQPVNTILNGKGAPKSSLGIDGDFYIDTRSLLIYGPKVKGKWPTPQSIQGPTGPSGSDGRNGSDGKSATNSNVNNAAGPQGVAGPQGPQGEKGEQGLPGAMGAAGLPGAAGAPGSAGPAGASGSTGAQGVAGPAGPQGETGTAGSNKLFFGDLVFNDLVGSIGTGENVSLNIFDANKSYLVRIRVYTYFPNDPPRYFLPLEMSITSTASGAIVHTSYLYSSGSSFRGNIERFENSIEAEVVLDGSGINVAYGIIVLVSVGRATSNSGALKIIGSFSAEEVQSAVNHA